MVKTSQREQMRNSQGCLEQHHAERSVVNLDHLLFQDHFLRYEIISFFLYKQLAVREMFHGASESTFRGREKKKKAVISGPQWSIKNCTLSIELKSDESLLMARL